MKPTSTPQYCGHLSNRNVFEILKERQRQMMGGGGGGESHNHRGK